MPTEFEDRYQKLLTLSMTLKATADAGAYVATFIDEVAKRRAEANALAVEIEGATAAKLAELAKAVQDLRAVQAEQAGAAKQVIANRELIARDKEGLRKLIDGVGQDLRRGRVA